MQRMLCFLLLLSAGIQTGKAQEKIYTQRNNVVKDGRMQEYTTYIRFYGDSGFVRTDFREERRIRR
ncbi:hypothetical protein MKQ70_13135 [Chitinophaga sedimenti]|uniref:hypothetical protein n=1 Tax=Chitinophaga sedimenti TaxID=2033606 RepID=UPI0020068123|nr:hypothetical protein [Chitinophaga sedimenti]MCK7555911.1 hypothetical protein [Chitinophaga sedimenti]